MPELFISHRTCLLLRTQAQNHALHIRTNNKLSIINNKSLNARAVHFIEPAFFFVLIATTHYPVYQS